MSRRKYTFEQRLEVVMHYLATDEGYRLTSARFNVPRTQVRLWVAAYDVYGEEGLKPRGTSWHSGGNMILIPYMQVQTM